MARVFYDFNDDPSKSVEPPAGCDHHFIDYEYKDGRSSKRSERVRMLDLFVRDEDDEVVVRSIGRLGKGRECHTIREQIEGRGAKVTVEPLPEKPKLRRGPAPYFDPPKDVYEEIKTLYKGPAPPEIIVQSAKEILEANELPWKDLNWDHLKNKYGARGMRKSRKRS